MQASYYRISESYYPKLTLMLTIDRDTELGERLTRQLRARVESLLAVVEDTAGDCEQADAVERRVT